MLQREEADEMAVRPFALRPLPVYVALNVVVAVHVALNVVVAVHVALNVVVAVHVALNVVVAVHVALGVLFDRDVGGLVLLGHGAHLLGAGFG